MANLNIQAGVNNIQDNNLQILNNNDSYNLTAKRDINYLAPLLQDIGIDSKFHDINSFLNVHSSIDNNDKLTIVSINIQSIRSKFLNLTTFLNSILEGKTKIDIICLQETNFFYQELYQINGYKLFILFYARQE